MNSEKINPILTNPKLKYHAYEYTFSGPFIMEFTCTFFY